MIIKLERVISCTSEHPSYPATNLLQQRSNHSWRCAKPGELLASVIFQFAEASAIIGVDIGNYRSCIVIVTASTNKEPDNWIPIVNHQFMTHDEAANSKFKDQVQLFTRNELNAETIKIQFDRAKVTCMQSANPREVFGLSFFVLRTEVTLQLGPDVFSRFKLKDSASTIDTFKEKYLQQFPKKQSTYKESLAQTIKETAAANFAKRLESQKEPMKRPILEKLDESARKNDEKDKNTKLSSLNDKKKDDSANNSIPIARTPFGDVIRSDLNKENKKTMKRRSLMYEDSSDKETEVSTNKKKERCSVCTSDAYVLKQDSVCKNCNKLPRQKPETVNVPAKKAKIDVKPKKPFDKLFEGITFALSGYVNPQRDEIRRKALKMGGKYVADPNITNNKCTHLVCAFKNTPKAQHLRGHTKIISHKFIEECYDKKIRFPWRRFALDGKEKSEPESEEEIEGSKSAIKPPNPYEQDTDPESDY